MQPGDRIGPFRLISQLGKGAMGEVWRARDERLDRYVALKVLPPDAAEDVERRARMLREARAAAAIRHANVVTLFDIITDDDGDDILGGIGRQHLQRDVAVEPLVPRAPDLAHRALTEPRHDAIRPDQIARLRHGTVSR